MIHRKNKWIFFWLLFAPVPLFAQQQTERWRVFEKSFQYAGAKNPFDDVAITAKFNNGSKTVTVNGFYDGDNVYKVRFMPDTEGKWNYVTKSNIAGLNNKSGSFECVRPQADNHGMVKVSDVYNFKYDDGKQFYPVGTTAYAWNHMGKELQKITLNSLSQSGFNKVRMCVFPKNYDLVKEEPEIYPFVKKQNGDQKFDYKTFNPKFFQILEQQILALDKIGIQADLILFHPYDKGRWGFDSMPDTLNKRYLKYLMARLSAFSNVWWSVANEWDLVKYKTHDEWIGLSKFVSENDPYHHLSSIHGSTGKYIEYWLPYYTHASVQDEAPVMNWGAATPVRSIYHKPVLFDEVGYEGNLKQRWGRYSGEEMTYLMWMGAIGGTYVTHGEAYMFKDATDTIFWAKGGTFKGESWKRAGFLKKILEDGIGPIEPADVSRDFKTATAGQGHYLVYFGKEMNEYWHFNLPAKNASFDRPKAGDKFKAEIIDTWDMTIQPVDEVFELGAEKDYRFYDKDMKKIRLPLKPYIALRISKIN